MTIWQLELLTYKHLSVVQRMTDKCLLSYVELHVTHDWPSDNNSKLCSPVGFSILTGFQGSSESPCLLRTLLRGYVLVGRYDAGN